MPDQSESKVKASVTSENLSFFAELKRRKVYRVGVAYLVASWLGIQVCNSTFAGFGVPDWIFRFVVIALVAGFPVAVILAYAFEVTPGGVKLTPRVDHDSDDGEPTGQRSWLPIVSASLIPTVVLGSLAVFFYFGDTGEEGVRQYLSEERPYYLGTVAVLPFQVISGGEETRAIAEGLHEELLTQLSGMKPVDVVSRTSTLQYREPSESLSDIANALGADFVIEGSVQRIQNEWRLTLQLIDAVSDVHLKSSTFDQKAEDGGKLLEQRLLAWKAAIGVFQQLRKENPPVAKAKSRYEALVRQRRESLEKLEIEFWGNNGKGPNAELLGPLLKATDEILSIDPLLGAIYRKKLVFKGQEGQAPGSNLKAWIDEMKIVSAQALQMDPDHYDSYIHTGTLHMYALGRPDRALPFLQKGVRLYESSGEVASNWPFYHLSWAYFMTGSPAVSLKILERVPNEPGFDHLRYWLGAYEFSRDMQNGIGFLEAQLARARQAGEAQTALELAINLAQFRAWWMGSDQPVVDLYESMKDEASATVGFRVRLLYFQRRYEEALEMISRLDSGSDPFAPDPLSLVLIRGVSLRESGHVELSKSYLEQSRKSLLGNDALFATQPGIGWSAIASISAYLGERQEALEAIAKAESHLDAAVSLPVYYLIQGYVARAYFELGEHDKALEKLELMLSGPTGSVAGRLLIDFREPEIYSDPAFQSLMRKYGHQLKDPAILDSIFEMP